MIGISVKTKLELDAVKAQFKTASGMDITYDEAIAIMKRAGRVERSRIIVNRFAKGGRKRLFFERDDGFDFSKVVA